MEKIEVIVTRCIEDIKSGNSTLSECLERYPEKRTQIEPLVKLALNIKEPASETMSTGYRQSVKVDLLKQIGADKQQRTGMVARLFGSRSAARPFLPRIAIALVVALFSLSSIVGGTVYASQDSVPGDLLYRVKIGVEDARLLFAGNGADKALLNMRFATIRLEEMAKVSNDQAKEQLAFNGYKRNLEAAGTAINNGPVDSGILTSLLETLNIQMLFCDSLIDRSQAAAIVKMAGELSVEQQVNYLDILEGQNNVQAARINLNAMQNRIQRAQLAANENQYQIMQDVLQQYLQFGQLGERILANAQANGNQADEIANLSLSVVGECLTTIGTMSGQVPQRYQSQLNNCLQQATQFQNQAHHRQQGAGGSENAPANAGYSLYPEATPKGDLLPGVTGNNMNEDSGLLAPGGADVQNGFENGHDPVDTQSPAGEPGPKFGS